LERGQIREVGEDFFNVGLSGFVQAGKTGFKMAFSVLVWHWTLHLKKSNMVMNTII
jgi:hypothetical protein